MTCAWKELLSILPPGIAVQMTGEAKDRVQEIRLRLGHVPELVCWPDSVWLKGLVSRDDLNFVVNTASRYSPWSAQTAAKGYLTAAGGHRIGICGETVMKDGILTGIRTVTSLCIRVARDYPNIAEDASMLKGSILIIGPPGSGKTTLLRDLIRYISVREYVGVVDERGELFPEHFAYGTRLDVLNGCPKRNGLDMILRTMGPSCVAVDEITAEEDCNALIRAGWCGIRLLATAHAGGVKDLLTRPLYRPILESGLFDHVLVLRRDKTWREERLYG